MGLTPKMALMEAMASVSSANDQIGSSGWIKEHLESVTADQLDNQGLGSNGWIAKQLTAEVKAIIAKYAASVYLPGVLNYNADTGFVPAVNDGVVGYVGDGKTASPFPATQSTAGFRPQLKSNGRPYYWLFDGSDDRLALSGPVFQMSDDHFVVACAKSLFGAVGTQTIFGGSSTAATNPLVPQVFFSTTGVLSVQWRDDAGAVSTCSPAAGIAAGESAVLSGTKVGNTKKARKNGGTWAIDATVMGATTINAATISGSTRTTYVNPFNGNIYGVIAGKGAITDAELLVLERYLGSLGGVAI